MRVTKHRRNEKRFTKKVIVDGEPDYGWSAESVEIMIRVTDTESLTIKLSDKEVDEVHRLITLARQERGVV